MAVSLGGGRIAVAAGRSTAVLHDCKYSTALHLSACVRASSHTYREAEGRHDISLSRVLAALGYSRRTPNVASQR